MNFSFPFRPVVSERPTLQRLLPLLLLAVGVNALLVLWPVQRSMHAAEVAEVALLRWGRSGLALHAAVVVVEVVAFWWAEK